MRGRPPAAQPWARARAASPSERGDEVAVQLDRLKAGEIAAEWLTIRPIQASSVWNGGTVALTAAAPSGSRRSDCRGPAADEQEDDDQRREQAAAVAVARRRAQRAGAGAHHQQTSARAAANGSRPTPPGQVERDEQQDRMGRRRTGPRPHRRPEWCRGSLPRPAIRSGAISAGLASSVARRHGLIGRPASQRPDDLADLLAEEERDRDDRGDGRLDDEASRPRIDVGGERVEMHLADSTRGGQAAGMIAMAGHAGARRHPIDRQR